MVIEDRAGTDAWVALEHAIDIDIATSRRQGRISSVTTGLVLFAAVVIALLVIRGLWPPRAAGAPADPMSSVQ